MSTGLNSPTGHVSLALPGTDDSVRGLTVDGWIVADEAARLLPALIAALRPMRARCPQARLVMLSTAWSRTDEFWKAWSSDDPSWLRIKATVDIYPDLIARRISRNRKATGRRLLQARIPRHSLGRPRQAIHLRSLQTGNTDGACIATRWEFLSQRSSRMMSATPKIVRRPWSAELVPLRPAWLA